MGPKSNDWCLYKRSERDFCIQRYREDTGKKLFQGGGKDWSDAVTSCGDQLVTAKDYQQPAEARREAMKESFLEYREHSPAGNISPSLASRTVRE